MRSLEISAFKLCLIVAGQRSSLTMEQHRIHTMKAISLRVLYMTASLRKRQYRYGMLASL